MPNTPKLSIGAEYPADRAYGDRPRWWLLVVIVVATVVPIVAIVIGATRNRGDSEARPADDLWGNRFEIVGIEAAEGFPDVPVDGSLTVEFSTDGQVRYSGCNGGFGSIEATDDGVRAGALASPQMACGGPEGEALMEWDGWFARLLEAGVTVAPSGAVDSGGGTASGEGFVLRGEMGAIDLRVVGPVEEPEPVPDPDGSVSSDATESSPG